MGVILSYTKNGKRIQEKFSSYYQSVVRSSELRKRGYKVSSEQVQPGLVPLEVKDDKDLVKDFLTRINKIKNIRKHGIRERGYW